jgi:hypothetical protein
MTGPPAWRLGEELITPHRKEPACYEMLHRASVMAGSCENGNEPSDYITARFFLTNRVTISF